MYNVIALYVGNLVEVGQYNDEFTAQRMKKEYEKKHKNNEGFLSCHIGKRIIQTKI